MSYFQFFLLFLLSFSLFASNIKETELEVAKWLAVEKEKSEAGRAWEQEQSILKSEATLLKNQLASTDKLLAAETNKVEQTKKRIKQITLTNQQQVEAVSDLKESYRHYLQLFKAELANFPKPLRDSLIKKLATNQNANLSVQFSELLNLMGEAQKLTKQWSLIDQTITIGSENILCQVLYAGVSKGFAVTRDQKRAFTGTFQQKRWVWVECSESKAISSAIKNYQNGGLVKAQLPFFGGSND